MESNVTDRETPQPHRLSEAARKAADAGEDVIISGMELLDLCQSRDTWRAIALIGMKRGDR